MLPEIAPRRIPTTFATAPVEGPRHRDHGFDTRCVAHVVRLPDGNVPQTGSPYKISVEDWTVTARITKILGPYGTYKFYDMTVNVDNLSSAANA